MVWRWCLQDARRNCNTFNIRQKAWTLPFAFLLCKAKVSRLFFPFISFIPLPPFLLLQLLSWATWPHVWESTQRVYASLRTKPSTCSQCAALDWTSWGTCQSPEQMHSEGPFLPFKTLFGWVTKSFKRAAQSINIGNVYVKHTYKQIPHLSFITLQSKVLQK